MYLAIPLWWDLVQQQGYSPYCKSRLAMKMNAKKDVTLKKIRQEIAAWAFTNIERKISEL